MFQFPPEHPSDQLFTLLSHTWWTFQYLIKEEEHVWERVLPWPGHAPVLCMMQLWPDGEGSLCLPSTFLTSACNCQAPFSQQEGTTQGASPCTSQGATYACWVVFLRCVNTDFVSSWCVSICFMQGDGAIGLQGSTVSVFAWISRIFWCPRYLSGLLSIFGYSFLCRHLLVCLNGTFGIQVWIGNSPRLWSSCDSVRAVGHYASRFQQNSWNP